MLGIKIAVVFMAKEQANMDSIKTEIKNLERKLLRTKGSWPKNQGSCTCCTCGPPSHEEGMFLGEWFCGRMLERRLALLQDVWRFVCALCVSRLCFIAVFFVHVCVLLFVCFPSQPRRNPHSQ